jgi:biopolymer transport protein ExbD
MIDVTFLLITFFMLASHFASAEKIDVDLPQPDNNQSVDRRFKEKVIVNILYTGTESAPSIRLGPMALASPWELAEKLNDIAGKNPRIEVILRADRRLSYGHVREVMQLVAAHKLTHLQIVTQLEK